MVRKYFLKSLSEAAVTKCSGNPFHKDTTRLQKMISGHTKSERIFLSLKVCPLVTT